MSAMELINSLLPAGVSIVGAAGLAVLSFAGSALTAGLGIGGGVLVMAGMLMFLPPTVVLPVHGVVQLGSNGGRAALMWRSVNAAIFAWFLLGTLVGTALGSQVLVAVPQRVLLILLALFILYTVWAPKLRKRMLPVHWYVVVGGFTSFANLFLGATGPLVAAFWSPERMGRHALVATHAICMTVQHALKVLVFGLLGFALAPWLPLLVVMLVAGFVGTMVGKKVLDSLPAERFAIGFRLVLTALSMRLIWQSFK